MLVITKIEDPEELDTRFSRFSPVSEEGAPESALPNELLDGAEQILNLLSPGGGNQETGKLLCLERRFLPQTLLELFQREQAEPTPIPWLSGFSALTA